MSDTRKKLSAAPAASALSGVELIYAVQSGTTKYATPAQFKTYVNTSPVWVPSASVTLGTNGQLAIEATSDTEITVKFRGSDGVTRSTIILLD